jgi:Glyoxalase-like domain
MTCQLDHIAIIAPSLKDGIVWVRDCLGLSPQIGGQHPQMGTHNMLLRLNGQNGGDDLFLELITIDPNAPKPVHSRWFGLDDRDALETNWHEGRRLRGMVARTDKLSTLTTLAGQSPELLGQPMRMTRGEREWQFAVRADGRLAMDGAVPHLMNWGAQGPAASTLPDLGCRLLELVLETPAPEAIQGVYDRIGFFGGPKLREGPRQKLMAVIETPTGVHLLT